MNYITTLLLLVVSTTLFSQTNVSQTFVPDSRDVDSICVYYIDGINTMSSRKSERETQLQLTRLFAELNFDYDPVATYNCDAAVHTFDRLGTYAVACFNDGEMVGDRVYILVDQRWVDNSPLGRPCESIRVGTTGLRSIMDY